MKRRSFLKTSFAAGVGAAAAPLLINGLPVMGFGAKSKYAHLNTLDSDRVMVIVQLNGGNDGLNTVVPFLDPAYAAARPGIKITYPQDSTHPEGYVPIGNSANGTGLNGRLATVSTTSTSNKTFKTLFDEGALVVVQGASYDNPNRSHFRATDIWMSGSDAKTVLDTGWFGRYLAAEYPNWPPAVVGANDDPLAIQIGYSLSRVLYGPDTGMGITIANPQQFENLTKNHPGQSSTDPPPATFGGDELKYVRAIVDESVAYGKRIGAVADAGTAAGAPKVTYPTGDRNFAAQLQIVAQLIAGGSQTKMYMVSIGGFDTHSGQTGAGGQNDLLQYLSNGIGCFMDDLAQLGVADRVIGLTFSEFGRRVKENGSSGTDHGTSAPMFVFGTGKNINGGIFGGNPSLTDLDANGDLKKQYDYREVYYSILERWFGADTSKLNLSLPGFTPANIASLPIIKAAPPSGIDDEAIVANDFLLKQNYPNPFAGTTTVEFSLNAYRDVSLKVFAENGREVTTLINEPRSYGKHTVTFDAKNLPAGNYLVRLDAGGGSQTRVMQLVR